MTEAAFCHRVPRARFTRALTHFCEHLDRQPVFSLWGTPSYSHFEGAGLFECSVRALWAFGSWSRGALTCGDLDLAIDYEMRWVTPPIRNSQSVPQARFPQFHTFQKEALGSKPPLVRVLRARDIRDNRSQMVIDPNALVPIWLAPDLDEDERASVVLPKSAPDLGAWKDRIAGITPDPTAGRAPRKADELMLRVEQTGMRLGQIERAVDARDAGLMDWEFRPHGRTRDEHFGLTEEELLLARASNCSDMPRVARTIAATRDLRAAEARIDYWYGNDKQLSPQMFERTKADIVVVTPTWTSFAPNGSLVIRKGANFTSEAAQAFDMGARYEGAMP